MSAMLVASPLCVSLPWAECAVERFGVSVGTSSNKTKAVPGPVTTQTATATVTATPTATVFQTQQVKVPVPGPTKTVTRSVPQTYTTLSDGTQPCPRLGPPGAPSSFFRDVIAVAAVVV
jgi:hypothetical protein